MKGKKIEMNENWATDVQKKLCKFRRKKRLDNHQAFV